MNRLPADWQAAATLTRRDWPVLVAQLDRVLADSRTIGMWSSIDTAMFKHRPGDAWEERSVIDSYDSARHALLCMVARAREPFRPARRTTQEDRVRLGEQLHQVALDLRRELIGTDLSLKTVLLLHSGLVKGANDETRIRADAPAAKEISARLVHCPDISLNSILLMIAERLQRFESLAPLEDSEMFAIDPTLPRNAGERSDLQAFVNNVTAWMVECTGRPQSPIVQRLTEATFELSDSDPVDVKSMAKRFMNRAGGAKKESTKQKPPLR